MVDSDDKSVLLGRIKAERPVSKKKKEENIEKLLSFTFVYLAKDHNSNEKIINLHKKYLFFRW